MTDHSDLIAGAMKRHLRISIDQDWEGMKYAILGIDEAAKEIEALSSRSLSLCCRWTAISEGGRSHSAPVTSWAEVAVKPLEWETTRSGFVWVASSAVGRYFVEERHNDFSWTLEIQPGRGYQDTLEAAKSAAQSDFETRIRSALVIENATPKDGVSETAVQMKLVSGSREEQR
jgi:hypothetical protein